MATGVARMTPGARLMRKSMKPTYSLSALPMMMFWVWGGGGGDEVMLWQLEVMAGGEAQGGRHRQEAVQHRHMGSTRQRGRV